MATRPGGTPAALPPSSPNIPISLPGHLPRTFSTPGGTGRNRPCMNLSATTANAYTMGHPGGPTRLCPHLRHRVWGASQNTQISPPRV